MVLLLYSPTNKPDEHVVGVLETAFRKSGQDFCVDRRTDADVQRAVLMGDWVTQADQVIAVISKNSAASEALEFELECVVSERRKRENLKLIVVRLGAGESIVGPVGSYALAEDCIAWNDEADNAHLVTSVTQALTSVERTSRVEPSLQPAGNVPPSTRFYTLRPSDGELDGALWAGESVVLVRGPRQVGKTSLIGRGAELVDEVGWRQVSTDFQKLNAFQLTDIDKFCLLLARTLARQLGLNYDFDAEWSEDFGPNLNLDHFMRAAINQAQTRLVWFMDEADRIFSTPLAADFYGLVRSWHNARATDPKGPWARFTVVIGYATEARLFIRDLNQSPFNVGRQITLESFTLHQTTDLNVRYGGPLKRKSDIEGLQFLLGGQPMLTRRALELLASGATNFSALVETADKDDGPFADHLKRVLYAVTQAPEVLATLRSTLKFVPQSDSDPVQRLIAAGILRDSSDGRGATLACDLYSQYLARHLTAL